MARRAGASVRQGCPDIELEISDFGPIARGKIALRPLTILVGPNGSGKSYASVLAHSVISACADISAAARSGDWAGTLMAGGEFQSLSEAAARIAATADGGTTVPRGFAARIRDCTVGRLFEDSLVSHMGHNFGSPLGALVRTGSGSSRIRIRGPVRADVSISRRGDATVRTRPAGARRPAGASHAEARGTATGVARRARETAKGGMDGMRAPATVPANRRGSGALLRMAAAIARQAAGGAPCGASHYLPAARSGVMCAHGTLAHGAAGGMRDGMRGGARAAGTVSDLAASLAHARKIPRNGVAGGGDRLVAGVLGGRLEARGQGALSYTRGATSVPMHMSSSGVHSAAPLALVAARMGHGDTLVVEGPEAHLHPGSQVRLATQLARLVRQGKRVVLSTHSPFILAQLSILVGLGGLTPAKRREEGYGEDDYMAAGEVAPYAFGGSARAGHTVSEIEHSVEGGILDDEFVSVAERMADDGYGIYAAHGKSMA